MGVSLLVDSGYSGFESSFASNPGTRRACLPAGEDSVSANR